MAAKVRPCVVLSVPVADVDRALVTVAPHTTSTRGSRFEVAVDAKFLKVGAFDAQNLVTIPHVKLIRKLGSLPETQMRLVDDAITQWLGLGDRG